MQNLGALLILVMCLTRVGEALAAEENAAAAAGHGKWVQSNHTSSMDDSPAVTLSLRAENPISGWPSKSRTPTLIIRCLEKKTDVIVETGFAAQTELGRYKEHTVRVRLDNGKATRQLWDESTDNNALFAPQSVQLAKQIRDAKRMLVEFVPVQSDPAIIEFDVSGLTTLLPEVAKACRWNAAGSTGKGKKVSKVDDFKEVLNSVRNEANN